MTPPRTIWRSTSRQFESLEARRLLATYQPGDANLDLRVDEADFVQVFKAGRYETDLPATWAQGDWDGGPAAASPSQGDGAFNATDLVAILMANQYRQGPYDAAAGVAQDNLRSLVVSDSHDTTIWLDRANGQLLLESREPLSTIHLASRSGLFAEEPEIGETRIFDVVTSRSQFRLDPSGFRHKLLGQVADPAVPLSQLLSDLRVDGSRATGGDIGDVRLAVCSQCVELPEAEQSDGANSLSVSSNAHSPITLIYDTGSGALRLMSDQVLVDVEIKSSNGHFSGDRPKILDGPSDDYSAQTVFLRERTGVTMVPLGPIVASQLALGDLQEDLQLVATAADDSVIQGAFLQSCQGCLIESNEATSESIRGGDANLDFFFDEADIIQAFKAGKFETGEAAAWNEGDWAGGGQGEASDGRFTSEDLVAAFQAGAYRQGSYHVEGRTPIHARRPLRLHGKADVVVRYFQSDGTVRIEGSETLLSTFHLHSQSGLLSSRSQPASQFDVRTRHSLFLVTPNGRRDWEFERLLKPGLTHAELVDDLTVDGSRHTGGGLGRVTLQCGDCAASPSAVQLPGDFTFDQNVDQADIDAMCARIASGDANDVLFDLNGDRQVDHDDLDIMIHDILETTYGDSNLDGQFNSSDLVQIFASMSEAQQDLPSSGWASGDWNCDGQFNSQDLILAFQDGAYIF